MPRFLIGVDVGGTKLAYGLFDAGAGHAPIDRLQHPTDPDATGPQLCDAIIKGVYALLHKNRLTTADLSGVGVGMPSFILFDEGFVCMTSAIPGVRDFAMRDYLRQRLPTRVVLDNDSNCAALAEHRFGAGRGSRHMVYMSASTGIGSGLIIERRLFRGSYGWAGECGHMIITPNEGLECGCRNRGCFMSWASGLHAPMHAAYRIETGERSLLEECDVIGCADILAAHDAGDELAISIVGQMAEYFALCAFNVYQLLNINLFVFGGGLVHFGDALFGPMRRAFDRLNHIPQPVEFRLAELTRDFGIIGAAALLDDCADA